MNTSYLTRVDAAEYAGVHVNTISRWIKEGRLTLHTVRGRLIRVDRAELEQLITPVAHHNNAQ